MINITSSIFKKDYIKKITRQLLEKMLNSEIQNYLEHDRNEHSNSDNVRNGTTSKKLITQ